MLAGDRIVHIDGLDDANPTWEQVEPRVMLSPNQPLNVTIQRGVKTFNTSITPTPITVSQIGSAGWNPSESVVVGDLEPDKPAAKAGLQEEDKIIAVDGKPLPAIDALIEGLQETKDKPIELTVLRGSQTLKFNVTPILSDTEDPWGKALSHWLCARA